MLDIHLLSVLGITFQCGGDISSWSAPSFKMLFTSRTRFFINNFSTSCCLFCFDKNSWL